MLDRLSKIDGEDLQSALAATGYDVDDAEMVYHVLRVLKLERPMKGLADPSTLTAPPRAQTSVNVDVGPRVVLSMNMDEDMLTKYYVHRQDLAVQNFRKFKELTRTKLEEHMINMNFRVQQQQQRQAQLTRFEQPQGNWPLRQQQQFQKVQHFTSFPSLPTTSQLHAQQPHLAGTLDTSPDQKGREAVSPGRAPVSEHAQEVFVSRWGLDVPFYIGAVDAATTSNQQARLVNTQNTEPLTTSDEGVFVSDSGLQPLRRTSHSTTAAVVPTTSTSQSQTQELTDPQTTDTSPDVFDPNLADEFLASLGTDESDNLYNLPLDDFDEYWG